MDLEALKNLVKNKESERVEFKEWKGAFSVLGEGKFEKRRCLLGYCVAIGNEGGGHLMIGVKNDGTFVGTSVEVTSDIKKQIFSYTNQKIAIHEVLDDEARRILIVSIPSRNAGHLLRFAGVPLMRVGESLEVMTEQEQLRILQEGQEDFSARLCEASSLEDVDAEALTKLRRLYQDKNPGNKTIEGISDEQFLIDLGLMRSKNLTYAALILLAKKQFLDLNLANAEISFEYRNRAADIRHNDRVDYRKPFVLLAFELWDKVQSRQQVHPIIEGLLRRDVPAFNEEVFREALFNAVCHRDYNDSGSIFIRQSPEFLEIISPGGFPSGVNAENIISARSTPRNRLLAETFQKIFAGVERSGQGADKIFDLTIRDGKGSPDYSESDAHTVRLIVPAMLKDENFVKYLSKISNEKQVSLSLDDIMLLEKIREGQREGITLKTVKHLLDQGLIELHGKTRGAQYVLARRFYTESGILGQRTRRIGLSRDQNKELILEHIRKHGSGRMMEFKQIFPELMTWDIKNLLQELKKAGRIEKVGQRRWSAWMLRANFKDSL